jgi:hypothetical protein
LDLIIIWENREKVGKVVNFLRGGIPIFSSSYFVSDYEPFLERNILKST